MPHNQQASRNSSVSKHSHSATKHSRPHKQPNSHSDTKPGDEPVLYHPPADPSEPPDYDYSRDRGRRIRLRAEEQCVLNHARAENSPLLDVKQWREKLRILRALPKPNEKETALKRPRHKPLRGKRVKDKKSGVESEKGLKISANIPSTAIDVPDLEDSDMVAFGDILDPKMSADTRFEKYLEELGKEGFSENTDLESLYNDHFAHLERESPDKGHTSECAQHGTGSGQKGDVTGVDEEINVGELVAKARTKRHVPVRSFSTDPVIQVSGTHGTLHEKQPIESRLSLNNFKLRLHISDKNESKVQNDNGDMFQDRNSPRKHQTPMDSTRKLHTVMDSARAVSEDVKLVKYVTKPSFSPRRMSLQSITHESQKEEMALRKQSLHLPISTTKNLKCKTSLPATNTVSPEVKGGGWKVTQSKREIDFGRMIPVSVIGSTIENRTQNDLWKFQT